MPNITNNTPIFQGSNSVLKQLRTQIKIGSEEKLGKLKLPEESEGIYASWNNDLNRKSVADIFEYGPINKVKTEDESKLVDELRLEINYKNWLAELKEKLKTLGNKA